MKILYISQYFPPEVGATQIRALEMATNLKRMGHDVTVLCEVPNHPKGIIFPGWEGKLITKRDEQGVNVIHVRCYTSPRKNFKTRMLFYLSFALAALLAGMFVARGSYDIVYATSPPLFTGLSGRLLAIWKRAKFVFEVRDLWPDSAIQLGELPSEGRAVDAARALEHWFYSGAKLIVGVTRGIRDTLIEARNGKYADRVRLITNGSNTELFMPAESTEIRRELGLEGKFVVIYGGVIGIAQGLETGLECAAMLKNENAAFLFVGEGPAKEELMKKAREMNLDNVVFHPEVSREKMPAMFCAADAAWAPFRKLPIFLGALPVKMFDSMACERPVLLGVDGEAREFMDKAGGGIYVEPENPAALAEAARRLMADPGARSEMGRRGREYVVAGYSRRARAEELARELEKLI